MLKPVKTRVEVAGGLTIEQALDTLRVGASVIVIGAPLVVDGHGFLAAGGDLGQVLTGVA